MDKVEFVKFRTEPYTTDLYALDSEGNVWRRIGPVEWESVPTKKQQGQEPRHLQRGLTAGELVILMQQTRALK